MATEIERVRTIINDAHGAIDKMRLSPLGPKREWAGEEVRYYFDKLDIALDPRAEIAAETFSGVGESIQGIFRKPTGELTFPDTISLFNLKGEEYTTIDSSSENSLRKFPYRVEFVFGDSQERDDAVLSLELPKKAFHRNQLFVTATPSYPVTTLREHQKLCAELKRRNFQDIDLAEEIERDERGLVFSSTRFAFNQYPDLFDPKKWFPGYYFLDVSGRIGSEEGGRVFSLGMGTNDHMGLMSFQEAREKVWAVNENNGNIPILSKGSLYGNGDVQFWREMVCRYGKIYTLEKTPTPPEKRTLKVS